MKRHILLAVFYLIAVISPPSFHLINRAIMYPPISDNFQKEFTCSTPSAPPLQQPLAPMTATGIPINPPNPPATNDFHPPVPWSTGLCDCLEDIKSCCLTCWCPCVTFGRIAEMVDRGSTACGVSGAMYTLMMCLIGCPCLYSCFYRSKLRGQYFLEERPCTDCCIHFWCEECALCQEYRELKNRGIDMSIGWHGNMERQKRLAAAMVPANIEGGMTRQY